MSTEPFRLDGRTAIVTGGGSGIGQAIALRMAGAGASVVCADIVPELAEETVEAIRSAGGTARPAIVDVSKQDQVEELVASVPELDVMCNNAGIINHFLVVDVTEAELDRIFAVNLKGVLFGCQAAARSMMQRGRGSIINMTSGAVDTPAPTILCYAMAKAAVAQLTKTLAVEMAPHGVRVNAVAPGPVDTRIVNYNYTDAEGRVDEERHSQYLARMRKMVPMGIMGEPDDMAYAALYLASDAARFMTGQTLHPNGGIAMPW
jgi:3-oxoacyl-[acyl-carrier protein] reductase